MTFSLPPPPSTKEHLKEALNVVKIQSKLMRHCLDKHRLMDAIKACSSFLSELRTNELSPRHYYELYMTVFDAMRHLTSYLVETHISGKHHLGDLYNLVQYASSIVPRLYLMVTVGTVYLSVPDAPPHVDVLLDMIEMTKGVQHPIRGLFLRHYLGGMTRDFMPQKQIEDIEAIVQFYLTNFAEMNKLWVRMQHIGHSRDRERRESERRELATLVGTNLVRLSQLEGVDLTLYETTVLPGIMNEVVSCQDVLAQEYLMDVVIQIFPDEFHMHTLKPFLATTAQLQAQVQIKTIIMSLLDRLSSFAQQEVLDHGELFVLFWQEIVELVKTRRTALPMQDQTSLLLSLAQFSVSCYPDRLDYMDRIFLFAYEEYHLNQSSDYQIHSKQSDTNLLELLLLPVKTWDVLLVITTLKHYQSLLAIQPYMTRRRVALAILESILSQSRQIDQPEQVYQLLEICHVLINTSTVTPLRNSLEEASLQERDSNGWIARLIHLFYSPDNDLQFLLLSAARQQLEQAEGDGCKIRAVLPSLIISSLQLARRYAQDTTQTEYHKKMTTLYTFLHQLIMLLNQHSTGQDSTCVQFALMAGQNADFCKDFDDIAFQFYLDAFRIYQESVAHSRAQFNAIVYAIGTLLTTSDLFRQHHLLELSHQLTQFGTKLLKKPDQSRAVFLSSHLWEPHGRVTDCLDKSIKIADHCIDLATNQMLLIELLNQSLYYFEKQSNPEITADVLNTLIATISTHMQHLKASDQPLTTSSSNLMEADDLKDYHVEQDQNII
ncbi:vacuolar protein sorting-associated protein 35 [Choanephora cucurbitarum]|nr:vacuolar protein sorting-associated protein 35 [Choanephora cucurbitarum]